jgi:hypothetical protein
VFGSPPEQVDSVYPQPRRFFCFDGVDLNGWVLAFAVMFLEKWRCGLTKYGSHLSERIENAASIYGHGSSPDQWCMTTSTPTVEYRF